jgi:hypothetical protein
MERCSLRVPFLLAFSYAASAGVAPLEGAPESSELGSPISNKSASTSFFNSSFRSVMMSAR